MPLMTSGGTPEQPDEAALMGQVDQHPDAHRATESDEEQVLAELYGDPDEDGFYLGEGA